LIFRLVSQALVNLKHGKARPAVGAGEFAFHALLFGDDHRSPASVTLSSPPRSAMCNATKSLCLVPASSDARKTGKKQIGDAAPPRKMENALMEGDRAAVTTESAAVQYP